MNGKDRGLLRVRIYFFPVSAENTQCCAAVIVLLQQIERRRRATCMLACKWSQWELSLLENENEYKFFHPQSTARLLRESRFGAAAATRLECIKKAWSEVRKRRQTGRRKKRNWNSWWCLWAKFQCIREKFCSWFSFNDVLTPDWASFSSHKTLLIFWGRVLAPSLKSFGSDSHRSQPHDVYKTRESRARHTISLHTRAARCTKNLHSRASFWEGKMKTEKKRACTRWTSDEQWS